MTLTIGIIWLPIAATIIAILLGIFGPVGRSQGDYDFGPGLRAIFNMAMAIFVIMLSWLLYFAFT